MSLTNASCGNRDLLQTGPAAALVWGLPSLLVLVGFLWAAARTWLWTPSFVVMGIACLANAHRCKRLHCYVTGPVFLLAALATLAGGLGVLAIAGSWILAAAVAGVAVGFGCEWMCGKYAGAASERSIP